MFPYFPSFFPPTQRGNHDRDTAIHQYRFKPRPHDPTLLGDIADLREVISDPDWAERQLAQTLLTAQGNMQGDAVGTQDIVEDGGGPRA